MVLCANRAPDIFTPSIIVWDWPKLLLQAGATIYEHSRVLELHSGAHPWARTAHGKVSAKFMVIAGNAYLGKTVQPLYGRVMPVTSFIVTTEPLGSGYSTYPHPRQ